MIYQTQLFKGLTKPRISLYQLQKAEAVKKVVLKILLLYLACFIIFAISTYFGIGTETYSENISDSIGKYEAGKLLLLAGKLISSLLYPTLFIWFTALFFWIALDIPYLKAVIVQMFALTVLLSGQLLTIPVLVLLDLNHVSNPFSFGVISQYVMDHEYWTNFFGAITVFHFVAIWVQYYYFRFLSEKNRFYTLSIVILFYLIVWLLEGLLAFLKISVLY
ncbi:hypothetical protein [Metabacillus halosaccharovorans]|uniref:hypothetical protein n=1 Tax=Metabacillus halosaccharovorans TaxID=930124 RepID=UPI0009949905|nr:hypothetical protein [Metabacillus halosaccharovorans]